jgi:hypothetical protein
MHQIQRQGLVHRLVINQVTVSFTAPSDVGGRLLLGIVCNQMTVLARQAHRIPNYCHWPNQRHKLHVQRMGDQSVWVV